MNIVYSKKFNKRFKKLPPSIQHKAKKTIRLFYNNPQSPLIKNHRLQGNMKGLRAFSITGDIRIIFEEYDNYVLVVMIDIGTHNQVYK